MTDHNSNSAGSLKFYCRQCDVEFDSAPDDSGYEQAECPACSEMCMTVEFESREQERNRSGEGVLHTILSFLPFTRIAMGLFRPDRSNQPPTHETPDPVTIVRYEDRLSAENDAEMLAREGIDATLDLTDSNSDGLFPGPASVIIELKVQPKDVARTRAVLQETDASPTQVTAPPKSTEDITFECEECGKAISFPGARLGKVETCPLCYEYIDVPND